MSLEIFNIRSQVCLLPVRPHCLILLAHVAVLRMPFIDLLQQLCHCWHGQRVEFLDASHIDRYTDASSTGVNNKWRLEQMVLLLRDFGIKSWVCVLDADLFFHVDELQRGQSGKVTSSSDRVNVGPFLCTRAAGSRTPFLLQRCNELGIG